MISTIVKSFLVCFAFIATPSSANSIAAFNDSIASSETFRNRKLTLGIGSGVVYLGAIITLDQLWYADYDRSSFHFFNDNSQWLQMDKVGHSVTAYQFAQNANNACLWAGYSDKQSRNIAAGYGLLFQSTIELLDGFSSEWGASTGDVYANMIGIGSFWIQDRVWNEQRIQLKYSHMKSPYADLRPNTFGGNFNERLLKDYNGQTYWLSGNIHSFTNGKNKIPKWLNIAAGYGIDGVTGGEYNVANLPFFNRRRQYYLGLDMDLTKIKTKSKVMKIIFNTFSFIKFPSPALEMTKDGSKFHWLYF